ncbi:hypothetical protein FRX31_008083 [Thalictrum thalictroides]|uniref:Uncharacterized protein n=1 Tax=Thalictrum thalictroides TaxID=46969 RepID=A0A7J6WY04_THATH|nr:hypothetical protein FRX31_008083 [Thalictrum thalictroides]
MNQFSERRTCGNGWSSLICPTIENKLKERIDAGKTWKPPIKSNEDLFEDFIDPMFSVLFYHQSYSHNIPPVDVDIGDLNAEHEEVVIPPEVRNQPG